MQVARAPTQIAWPQFFSQAQAFVFQRQHKPLLEFRFV